jgi:hypothetical protein
MKYVVFMVILSCCTFSATAELTDGLAGYWDLDGDADDKLGLNNGAVHGATSTTAVVNEGYQFDGNDYISIEDDDALDVGTGDFSISLWFKTLSENSENVLIAKIGEPNYGATQQLSDARPGYNIIMSNGRIFIQLKVCITNTFCPIYGSYSSIRFNDNRWHHLVGIVNREKNVTIYVDGEVIETQCEYGNCITSLDLSNSNKLLFGDVFRISTQQPWGLGFDGSLDEIGLWKRVLTEEEIQELYQMGLEDKKPNELLIEYSPILHLHSSEKYWPMEVEEFLELSDLRGPGYYEVAPTSLQEIEGKSSSYYLDLTEVDMDSETDFLEPSILSSPNNIYARIVNREDGYKALQYYFFYPFNNWKNSHEGDWEFIQVVLDENNNFSSAAAMFHGLEVETTYRGDLRWHNWTHPVVMVGRGSHASYFENFNPYDYQDQYLFKLMMSFLKFDDFEKTAEPFFEESLEMEGYPYKLTEINGETAWTDFPGRWGQVPTPSADVKSYLGSLGPRGPRYMNIFGVINRWSHPFLMATRPKWHDHLVGFLNSPANLHVYDSSGNHVGDGGGINEYEIEGTEYYTGPDSHPESFFIYGSDSYRIEIIGGEEGEFSFDLFYYRQDNGGIYLNYSNIATKPGSRTVIYVYPGSDLAMHVDMDDDGHIDRMLYPVDIMIEEDFEYEFLDDRDKDSVPDLHDNCFEVKNQGQEDFNEDGKGDVCDNPVYYKKKALDLLSQVDLEDSQQAMKMDFAIGVLTESLSLFEDEFTPTDTYVFELEKEAVIKLEQIIKKQESKQISDSICLIVDADKLMAEKALDWTNLEAVEYYHKASGFQQDGKFIPAIDNYAACWQNLI